MKNDQYIPHEVSTRTCSQVINLIETEGCAGYGIYWALLEYLRVQENYVGDLQALSSLKRQLKIRQSKLDKVLYGYGLFVCDGKTFYSPKLIEVMKPFEDSLSLISSDLTFSLLRLYASIRALLSSKGFITSINLGE